jgi:hypothetical protein
LGGGGNDVVKNTNTNEIQILFAGYQKPAKLGKVLYFIFFIYVLQCPNFLEGGGRRIKPEIRLETNHRSTLLYM